MWLFARRAVQQIFLDAKFVIGAAIVLSLFVISSFIAVLQHERALQEYNQQITAAQQRSDLEGGFLVKSPHPLDFISAGKWRYLPRVFLVGPRGVEPVEPEEFTGSFLTSFEELDWANLVAIALSLLTIFASYNVVSGEKEDGTLRLVLSYPVRRSSFIIGAFLGLMGFILVPLLLGFLLSLLIINLSPEYQLNTDRWVEVVLVMIYAILYLALFSWFSILVSTLCKQSSTALIWLLLFWIVFIVILPSNGGVLAAIIEPTPLHRDEVEKVEQIKRNYRLPILDYHSLVRRIVDGGGPAQVVQYNLDRLRDKIVAQQQQQIEERNRLMAAVHDDFARRRFRQMRLTRLTTTISPAVTFREMIESLLTSGYHDHAKFLEAVRAYQAAGVGAFAKARQRHAAEAKTRQSWEVAYAGYTVTGVAEWQYGGIKPDPDLFPPFAYDRPPVERALVASLWGVLMMVGLSLSIFMVALVVFSRYDPR